MMRLLVSVRDADEAKVALAAGVDLIDVKEPLRGALGAADAEQIAAVVREVNGRVPVSAALGELFVATQSAVGYVPVPATNAESQVDSNGTGAYHWPVCRNSAANPLAGIQFAKFGLAEATKNPRWREIWANAIQQLPAGVKSVAVVYADWRACDAPSPGEVIDLGLQLGCAAVLIDTHDKTQGRLLDYCSLNELESLVERAREQNLITVLGGSLDLPAIRLIAPLRPDFAAVRTAVCETHRAGRMDETRVRKLVQLLAELNLSTRLKTHKKLLDRPYELG